MKISANDIELEYETFGREGDPTLLLIMGLGAQMTLWDEKFCEMLVGHGYFVIRYDNRDIGLSTHFDEAGPPRSSGHDDGPGARRRRRRRLHARRHGGRCGWGCSTR